MKIKRRILSLALAGAMALGLMPGMTMTALAAENSTDYTVTIPATLSVSKSGWNDAGGITAAVKSGDTFDTSKKLTVTAASANSWALKSGDNSVGYNLATASGDYSASAEVPSWEFSADELNATSGTNKGMGIIVDDYTDKPAGEYKDTVTFTAKVETAGPQLHSFTLTGPYTHQSLLVEFYDGDKWSDMVTKYSPITYPAGNYVGFSSDGLICKNGSKVEMNDTVDPNATYSVE